MGGKCWLLGSEDALSPPRYVSSLQEIWIQDGVWHVRRGAVSPVHVRPNDDGTYTTVRVGPCGLEQIVSENIPFDWGSIPIPEELQAELEDLLPAPDASLELPKVVLEGAEPRLEEIWITSGAVATTDPALTELFDLTLAGLSKVAV